MFAREFYISDPYSVDMFSRLRCTAGQIIKESKISLKIDIMVYLFLNWLRFSIVHESGQFLNTKGVMV